MDLKVEKVVNLDRKYKDKEGKEHTSVNYYLMINNSRVAIRPCFSKGYVQLDLVCETIINGKSE